MNFLVIHVDRNFTCLGQLRVILSSILEVFIPRAFPLILLKGGESQSLNFIRKEEREMRGEGWVMGKRKETGENKRR